MSPRISIRSNREKVLSLCLLLLAFGSSAPADPLHWEIRGSSKSIASLQHLRHTGVYTHEYVPQFEERLRLHGSISNEWIRLEAADEATFIYERYNPASISLPDPAPVSAWTAKWNITRDNEKRIDNRIDRLFVQVTRGPTTLIVGKQVIATGVGQIFTAVSQVQRYPYIFIDTEFEKTEDAASFIWSGPLQLEARYLPKTGTQKKDNFHVRAKGSKGGFDTALTVGRSDDKAYAGLEAAGNWGSAVVRGELVGYEQNQKDWIQALLGWDYVISAKWSAKAEVFYNGFGELSGYQVAPYVHRSAPFLGRWYAAGLVTWETHALLKSNLLAIVNLQDPSTLLHLYFNYSLSNNVDLLFGQFVNLGEREAEFAGKQTITGPLKVGLPDVTYATLRWYF